MICCCIAEVMAGLMSGAAALKGVEGPRMPWEVCMGLRMELVSETDEQTMVPGEATVRTRCLAMFATPMRERAVKDTLVNTKAECKRRSLNVMVFNASVKI